MTNKREGGAMKSRNDRGFSLVEVLVAAAVIMVSLVSVVAFVRKGQEMIALERHRAMARGIIDQQLEKWPFQPDYYDTLPATRKDSTIVLDTAGTDLQGNLTDSVGIEKTTTTGAVPYRIVWARVWWTEPGKHSPNNDTVIVTKWLADVKRN